MLKNSSRHYSPLNVPVFVFISAVFGILTLLPPIVTVVVLTLLTIVAGYLALHFDNYVASIFSVAYLLRLFVILVDSKIGLLPSPPIATGHNQHAIQLVSAWTSGQFLGVLSSLTPMRIFIAHILSPFYILIGKSPISGRIGIATISLLIGYIIFKLAREVVDRRTSMLAAAIVLLWPTIFYRSIVIQREVVVTVVLLTALWAASRMINEITVSSVILVILCTLAMVVLRKENLVLIAAMVGVVSLIKSRDKPYYLAGFALLAIPFTAFFILNFNDFTGYGTALTPQALDAFAYGRAHGSATYLIGLHYNTWLDVILYAPVKILYFLYSPFPWQIRGMTGVLAGGSAIMLFVATLFLRRGIATLKNRPYYLTLLLSYLVLGITTYAIVEMNYGAAVRRRIQFVPILILIGVVGLSNVRFNVRW
ncbi:glycosyltransferase family 39 protein [Haloarcula nitratireducens]|uniref:Glycosyltransferase family 39 protein n=1 Tax=Haloarcula nitratireducens TaxID=2487749 RepID=A0AAW4PHF1_9EURY|nr:glycosyltransferase family 39 protein [Halomicroarcula nitratireducens]MBX0296637.1 glycosyltransferase family 39 protein [Halomicroarcula nitratireducens]